MPRHGFESFRSSQINIPLSAFGDIHANSRRVARLRRIAAEKNTKSQLSNMRAILKSLRALDADYTTFSAKEIVRDRAVCYKGRDSQEPAMQFSAVSLLPIVLVST